MENRFTDRAKKVLALAENNARQWGHTLVSTDHLFFGLFMEGSGVAANVLKKAGVTLDRLEAEMEKTSFRLPTNLSREDYGPVTYSPRCKTAFVAAHGFAALLQHKYVGTEHLLLGVLEENQGVSMSLLKNLGLDPKTLKDEVFFLLGYEEPKPKQEMSVQEECNYYKGVIKEIEDALHEEDDKALSKIRQILKDN